VALPLAWWGLGSGLVPWASALTVLQGGATLPAGGSGACPYGNVATARRGGDTRGDIVFKTRWHDLGD